MNATAVNRGYPVLTCKDFQIDTGRRSTTAIVTVQNVAAANSEGFRNASESPRRKKLARIAHAQTVTASS
jgi:hypothetical protein